MHLTRRTFALSLLAALVIGGLVGAWTSERTGRRATARFAPVLEAPLLPVQMPLTTGTFAKVAEAVKPAVININTLARGGGQGGRTPFEEFFGEEFFRRFFGDAPERIPQRSLGSGVIVDPSGIALTNAHVVEKATEDRKSTRLNSSHIQKSRMPSSA